MNQKKGSDWDLVVVGAGAAGFFAVSEVLTKTPQARVLILEKTGKTLAKVRISGGGRCNVTNHCPDPEELIANYPRGSDWLKVVFQQFAVVDTWDWFLKKGVSLHREADGRMFPVTNSSESIVQALQQQVKGPGLSIHFHAGVRRISPRESGGFVLETESGESIRSANVLIASGGGPKEDSFGWMKPLALKISPPVPSLFTFNVPKHPWAGLQGLSFPDARVSLNSGHYSFRGPVLVTHWGFSGPAVLKLSAFAARELAQSGYEYAFSIDFLPGLSNTEIHNFLTNHQALNSRQKPDLHPLFGFPRRFWEQLCMEAGLNLHFNWAEVGKKKIQSLAQLIKSRSFQGKGKTTYKDEFVTAGGIALEEVNASTCESLRFPGLFFAGEVLDVDGITGGFNFQAAWSTAYVAAKSISERLRIRG